MQNAAKILIVDDEPAIQRLLQLSLQRAGYMVQTVGTGQAALDRYAACPSDLVLLDARLPDMEGFTVCQELRKHSHVPIVMLTAMNRTEDLSHGFSVGVDDYIVKPYHLAELTARLRAVLRRSAWQPPYRRACYILATPELLLNDTYHEVWIRGTLTPLTPLEYRLLCHLMRHPNCLLSKSELCQTVWGYPSTTDTNHVEVTICRLRQKIEVNPTQPRLLLTIQGSYLFAMPTGAAQATPTR